jgi:antitoxin component of RelBE/YafQ-DinJ toxin-antitoxin module
MEEEILITVDKDVKDKLDKLFEADGGTTEAALKIIANQIASAGSNPFKDMPKSFKLPTSDYLRASLNEGHSMVHDDSKIYNTKEELVEDFDDFYGI